MILKWRCERLNINAIKHPCANAKSMGTFACSGCPGPINIEREIDVSSKCKHEGCSRTAQHGKKGLCCTHYNELMGKKVKQIKPDPTPPVVAAPVPDLPDDFGKVKNSNEEKVTFGTDAVVVLALREAWAAKEAEWLAELSGLSPLKTIAITNQMVRAIDGMGF